MNNFIKISNETIKKALIGVRRKYFAGNLKKTQNMEFIKTDLLEIGITSYDTYTTEDVHFHNNATEYQYMISGNTQYMDVNTKEIFEFKTGDFYAIMPDTTYAQKSQPGTTLIFIKVPSINDKTVVEPSKIVSDWYKKGFKDSASENDITLDDGIFQLEGEPITFTSKRMKHCLGVAQKMKALAMECHPEDYEFQQDMYLLGLVHDITY